MSSYPEITNKNNISKCFASMPTHCQALADLKASITTTEHEDPSQISIKISDHAGESHHIQHQI